MGKKKEVGCFERQNACPSGCFIFSNACHTICGGQIPLEFFAFLPSKKLGTLKTPHA
jgi:hypothetical protein